MEYDKCSAPKKSTGSIIRVRMILQSNQSNFILISSYNYSMDFLKTNNKWFENRMY